MRRPVPVLVIALLCARVAGADPITISGTGTVSNFCGSTCLDLLGLPAAVMDPITFSLSFDNTAPDQWPTNPALGVYAFGLGSFTVNFGTNTLTRASQVNGYALNDEPGDQIFLSADALDPSPRLMLPLLAIDPSANLLSSDAWPTDLATAVNAAPPGSSTFAGLSACPLGGGEACEFIVTWTDLRLTQTAAPAPVPEPTTLLLIGSGVLGAAGTRRWRHPRT